MKIIRVSSILEEAKLSLGELSKTSPFGGLRGDDLIRKIRNGDPIKVNNNDKIIDPVIIDNISDKDGSYDPNIAKFYFKNDRYYRNIISMDGSSFKLNDIDKTSDFGGGPGSSLGTTAARDIESIQCLYLSYRQSIGINIKSGSYKDIFNHLECFNNIEISPNIKLNRELVEKYVDEWETTFFKTANALYNIRSQMTMDKRIDNILDNNIHYTFFQIGCGYGLIKAISNKYNSFKLGIPISKWTPSDIWAASSDEINSMIDTIDSCSSIIELNNVIDNLFNNKKLVGISLKKLSYDYDKHVNLVINKETPYPSYEFNKVVISDDPFSTTNISIIANRKSKVYGDVTERINVRSSGGQSIQDINCEVLGQNARHGSIGLLQINKILKNNNTIQVPTVAELKDRSYEELVKDIVRMNNTIKSHDDNISKYSKKPNSIQKNRIISKYQALYLGIILHDNNDLILSNTYPYYSVSDKILQGIFYYAMAIENREFRSPKYVRVI